MTFPIIVFQQIFSKLPIAFAVMTALLLPRIPKRDNQETIENNMLAIQIHVQMETINIQTDKTYEFTVAIGKFVQIQTTLEHWWQTDYNTPYKSKIRIFTATGKIRNFPTNNAGQTTRHFTNKTQTPHKKAFAKKYDFQQQNKQFVHTSNHRNQFDPSYSLPLTKHQRTTTTTPTYQTVSAFWNATRKR